MATRHSWLACTYHLMTSQDETTEKRMLRTSRLYDSQQCRRSTERKNGVTLGCVACHITATPQLLREVN